jgi:hypothetical protein
MSLSGLLDVDREILRHVEDRELLKVCSINKKMWNHVCDDAFLKRRMKKYFEIKKYRKDESLKQFFSKMSYYIDKMWQNYNFEYREGDFEKQFYLLRNFKGIDLFIESAAQGELCVIKYTLNNGTDINSRNNSALIEAIRGNYNETIKFLIENGADIHIWSDYPIENYIRIGHLEMFKFLISHGCDIHMRDERPLRLASRYGHYEMVKWLINQGCDIHSQLDYALRLAAKEGHFPVVKLLVESGANVHAKKNYALKQAIKAGFSEIVEYLQEYLKS